jgi:hypothetical protein
MQMLMTEFGNRDLRAYFVWIPVLSGDSEQAARKSTERYPAPNSGYFWLTTPKAAQEAASVLHMAAGRLAWDVYLLYRRGLIWEASFPSPSYWQHQLDILQGDAFNPQVFRARIHDALG